MVIIHQLQKILVKKHVATRKQLWYYLMAHKRGMLVKRLNTPPFHGGTHGFESRTCHHIFTGVSYNGSTSVSKTADGSSILSTPASKQTRSAFFVQNNNNNFFKNLLHTTLTYGILYKHSLMWHVGEAA